MPKKLFATQAGGLVAFDYRQQKYIFVKKPKGDIKMGDPLPEGWDIVDTGKIHACSSCREFMNGKCGCPMAAFPPDYDWPSVSSDDICNLWTFDKEK